MTLVTVGILGVSPSELVQCAECWCVIHINRRDEHEQAVHTFPEAVPPNAAEVKGRRAWAAERLAAITSNAFGRGIVGATGPDVDLSDLEAALIAWRQCE